jgi:hypothetical protein
MTEFRMTRFWPGNPLPIPDVLIDESVSYYIRDTDHPGFPDATEWWLLNANYLTTTVKPLPEELAIRELVALDVQDGLAVLSFTRSFGLIAQRAETSGIPKSQRPGTRGTAEPWECSVRDVQFHLEAVQAVAKHWLSTQRGEPTIDAWADYWPVDSEAAAGDLFVRTLNNGLRWLHVHVEGEVSFPGGEPQAVGANQPGLYAALCLQMYNLVLEGETDLRVCPSCGVSFVRQRGRALAKQFRTTGVTYCSKRCANREAARAHRARNAKRGVTQ